MLAWNFIHDLGLATIVQVNSIGNAETRAAYGEKLVAHYRANRSKLCEDCKRRLGRNPLRLLDCKQDGCREVRADAPQILDSLDEESKNHFMRVLEYLDEVENETKLEFRSTQFNMKVKSSLFNYKPPKTAKITEY
jgi:histidyl-tRNA synthetase